MAVFTASGVTFYNALGEQVEKKSRRKSPGSSLTRSRGGYDHFMLKEIHEQPRALQDTISPRVQKGRVVLDDVQLSREYLEGLKRIYIVACGSGPLRELPGEIHSGTDLPDSCGAHSGFRVPLCRSGAVQ